MAVNREDTLMRIRSHGVMYAILLTPLLFYFASGVKAPMELSPAAPERANIAAKPLITAKPQTIALPQEVIPSPAEAAKMTKFKSAITTVFWVGEGASDDNGHIHNYSSYWDPNWVKHYGGVDDPEKRKGFFPAGFTPKENPFYIALPFAEIDDKGRLKESAKKIPEFGEGQPLTKNRWVEIRYKGKTCYGQWEDVGPFGENDFDWVFGSATKPKNREGEKAGLDVSPAIAMYVGLTDTARTEWRFVDEKDVPDGPWRKIVTR